MKIRNINNIKLEVKGRGKGEDGDTIGGVSMGDKINYEREPINT